MSRADLIFAIGVVSALVVGLSIVVAAFYWRRRDLWGHVAPLSVALPGTFALISYRMNVLHESLLSGDAPPPMSTLAYLWLLLMGVLSVVGLFTLCLKALVSGRPR